MWQTLGFVRRKKITYSVGGCKTEIGFVLVGKSTDCKESVSDSIGT